MRLAIDRPLAASSGLLAASLGLLAASLGLLAASPELFAVAIAQLAVPYCGSPALEVLGLEELLRC
jgi:hypothetical protein